MASLTLARFGGILSDGGDGFVRQLLGFRLALGSVDLEGVLEGIELRLDGILGLRLVAR